MNENLISTFTVNIYLEVKMRWLYTDMEANCFTRKNRTRRSVGFNCLHGKCVHRLNLLEYSFSRVFKALRRKFKALSSFCLKHSSVRQMGTCGSITTI